MKINENFFNSIKPALVQLREKIGDDFVIFGSAPLYLLGVVDFNCAINDLDIAVRDKSKIPKDAQKVFFQKNPDQDLYKIKINGLYIDIGSCWKGQEDYFYKLFENPIIVEGFNFVNLDILEEWKEITAKKYHREKDLMYLKKIKEYKQKDGQ